MEIFTPSANLTNEQKMEKYSGRKRSLPAQGFELTTFQLSLQIVWLFGPLVSGHPLMIPKLVGTPLGSLGCYRNAVEISPTHPEHDLLTEQPPENTCLELQALAMAPGFLKTPFCSSTFLVKSHSPEFEEKQK